MGAASSIQHYNLSKEKCQIAHFAIQNGHFIVLETPENKDRQVVQFILSENQFKQLLNELSKGS